MFFDSQTTNSSSTEYKSWQDSYNSTFTSTNVTEGSNNTTINAASPGDSITPYMPYLALGSFALALVLILRKNGGG